MTYTPIAIERFGGLNLRDEPREVGLDGCIDMLNVDLDQPGRVRLRAGTNKINNTAPNPTGGYTTLCPLSSTALIAAGPSSGAVIQVDQISTGGTVTNVDAGTAQGTLAAPLQLVRYGTEATGGTAEVTYVFIITGGNVSMRKYDGTSITGAGSGKPRHISVWTTANRFVQGSYAATADTPSGADGSGSTVFFSDPGKPTTYGANNFVHLRPGDGESIQAIVGWRELLFVFKETVVFVFYGEGTDEAGNPIFNYRTIDLPRPLRAWTAGDSLPVAAGWDGVYYITAGDGYIYRTAGDLPVSVSDAVTTRSSSSLGAPDSIGYARDRLYGPVGAYTVVYDITRDFWLKWDSLGLKGSVVDWAGEVCFPATDGVYFFNSNGHQDNGSAISSYYQSGWGDFGSPDPKVIREVLLSADNDINFQLTSTGDSHPATTLATISAFDLIGTPAHVRTAHRGRQFSWKAGFFDSGSTPPNEAWSLGRLVFHLRDQRGTGEER